MRLCLSFLAVKYMRQGNEPSEACRLAIERLQDLEPNTEEENKRMHKKHLITVKDMRKVYHKVLSIYSSGCSSKNIK